MIPRKFETDYNTGYICVSVGASDSKGGLFSDAKPQETAPCYYDVDDVVVYIDGIEYGGIEKPFGAFAVAPGYHVVKIVAYKKYAGRHDKYVESKAQQVNVTGKSAFLFYHWNFYYSKHMLNDVLFSKVFDNVNAFLIHTHQF